MNKERRITDHWLRNLVILFVINTLYVIIISKIIHFGR